MSARQSVCNNLAQVVVVKLKKLTTQLQKTEGTEQIDILLFFAVSIKHSF